MLFGETANEQQQIQNSPRAADELRVLAVRERDGDRLRGRYLGSGRPCSLHLSMYSSTSWSTRPARQQVRNLEAPKRQQTTAKVGEIPFKKNPRSELQSRSAPKLNGSLLVRYPNLFEISQESIDMFELSIKFIQLPLCRTGKELFKKILDLHRVRRLAM